MDSLIELVASIPQRPLGTVVHVGAGSFAAEHYAGIDAKQIVLVEGDPDTAAALQRDTDDHGAPFEIVAAAVAPVAGPITWHRYNVRMLNGPTAWSGLDAVYPRLRCIETLTLTAMSFEELLTRPSLPPGGPGTPTAVLVLDVPSQEADLLSSVSPGVLRRFRWIASRMQRRPEPAGAAASPDGAALRAAGFVAVPRAGDGDPLWPVRLYRFDSEQHARQEAERQLAATRHALKQANAELEQLRGELTTLRATREELQRKLSEAEASRSAAQQQLGELKALRVRADDLQKKLTEADAARTAGQAQQADRDARQQLLDIEILKAEAQLELVKDVLLREKNF